MAFQLNTSVVSSEHKIPLHVLSQVLASLTPAHPLFKRLHWLPIDARIKFKIATLTFKALNTGNPPSPACFIGTIHAELYDPPQLTFCPSHDPTYHLAPVPFALLLRLSGTVSLLMSTLLTFRKHLKSHLFQSSFPTA